MTEAQAPAANAATAISVSGPEGSKSPNALDFTGSKHKVKVSGRDEEVDYDELKRGYQKAKASDERFREAIRKEQQAETAQRGAAEIESKLASGDVNWLVQKLGADKARAVFEGYLIEQLEFEQLPESEKRARAAEARATKLEHERESEKEEQKKHAYSLQVQKAHDELNADISEALKADGKKPTPRLVLRILDEIEAGINGGNRKIPAAQAKEKAIAGIHRDIAEYLPQIAVEKLVQILPKEVLDRLRNYEVGQVLDGKQQRRVRVSDDVVRKPKEPITVDQFYKHMEKKIMKK